MEALRAERRRVAGAGTVHLARLLSCRRDALLPGGGFPGPAARLECAGSLEIKRPNFPVFATVIIVSSESSHRFPEVPRILFGHILSVVRGSLSLLADVDMCLDLLEPFASFEPPTEAE